MCINYSVKVEKVVSLNLRSILILGSITYPMGVVHKFSSSRDRLGKKFYLSNDIPVNRSLQESTKSDITSSLKYRFPS